MSFIYSITSTVPSYHLTQDEYYDFLVKKVEPRMANILRKILDGSQIKKRHFSVPFEEFSYMTENKMIEEKFKLWKETSVEFLERQCRKLINDSGLTPDQIDGICLVSTTGMVTPHLDVLLQDKLGLRPDIIRLPITGLGCSGGIAGINRVKDLLNAMPDKAFLVCAAETLCTQYERPESISIIVANSIFGDGYASALMVGREHPLADESKVEIMDTKSYIFSGSNFAVGQWMTDEGIHSHVDYKLPNLIRENAADPIYQMLNESGVDKSEIDYWIMHAGGPKVMEAFGETMDLDSDKLELTLETFRQFGNQSAVSIMTAMDRALTECEKPGLGYLMGLGPGIHMEYGLCKVLPNAVSNKSDSEEASYLSSSIKKQELAPALAY